MLDPIPPARQRRAPAERREQRVEEAPPVVAAQRVQRPRRLAEVLPSRDRVPEPAREPVPEKRQEAGRWAPALSWHLRPWYPGGW